MTEQLNNRNNVFQHESVLLYCSSLLVFLVAFAWLIFLNGLQYYLGFPGGSEKNLPSSAGAAGDMGLIPGLERSPREGNGNPLQYSYRENPMDKGALQAIVHGFTKSTE